MKNKWGPDVVKLLSRFIARNVISSSGGLAEGIEFFKDPEHRRQVTEKAEIEMAAALRLVKAAPNNPYKSDEEIAGALLEKIEAKERGKN